MHRVQKTDPMLTDGLEGMAAMGQWTAAVIGNLITTGMDFVSANKQLGLQQDQINAQIQANNANIEVARIELEAAKVARDAAALQATADQKGAEARAASYGLDINKLIIPIGIAGVVGIVAIMMFKGKRRRR